MTRVDAARVRIVVPGERAGAQPKVMTYQQVDQVLSHLGEPDRLLFLCMSRTGLRISEALGLQWRDLELNENGAVLEVRRQSLNGEVVDKLKSEASHRRVALMPALVEELLAHRDGQHPMAGHEPMFSSETGSHQDSHNVRRRLRKATDACGLPWVTPHVFRHSFATEMRDRGYNPSVISKILGHRNEAFTRSVYIHTKTTPRFDDFDARGQAEHTAVPEPFAACHGGDFAYGG